MAPLKECPRVLLQKLFSPSLHGAGGRAVGAVYYIRCLDTVFLALTAPVCWLVYRCYSLYRLIAGKHYCVTEGVCTGITPKPLRRYRSVRLMDAEGLETTLLLDKRTRVKIGFHYRIYFKQDPRPRFGSEYLDTALSGDCFLGMEELGEFSAPDDSDAAMAKDDK
jgi:hypothetical protein